ncbi:NAD(P)-dependent alcohol dehydrogenase [Amycolatopsis sp.]|uniref:NAD(P)-dependent alcohol dehydrogenase n=1 Tax=Amycolatopsis sp. TaxID=37632 RepID=UPI002C9B13C8|nr:NAD(P)-dependent alcohol dehydrogenase [Amycolatopsis sp.]HVV07931.1 NAD(P)-dependent alcohol dehydrogenase [Amycolatopsis sp.]
MRIRAAVAREKGAPFVLEDLTLDEPRPGEVLVEVGAAGICHTDIAVRDQWMPLPLPIVLGHEGAGIVRAVGGSVTKVVPGDRVVMSYWHCGSCRYCASGHPAYCVGHAAWTTAGCRPDGTNALHGDGPVHGFFFAQSSFATHAIATERNVVKIGADADLTIAGPLACGLQTGAGTVINRLAPRPGSALAVFGAGAVGLAAVMAARVAGCATVVAVDIHRSRLALAEQVGATHTIDASATGDVVGAVRDIVAGGVQYTVETSAVPAVAAQALESLAPMGTCAILGLGPQGTRLSADMTRLLTTGRTITGVTMGDGRPDELIPGLLELHRQGRFPVDRLVTTYPFAEINQAVADAESGRIVKAVLVPG